LKSEFEGLIRRIKPEKHQFRLKPRHESELEFLDTTRHRPVKLLYDTTVYIDILQDRFPQLGDQMLRTSEAWHSPVTEAELALSCGLLNPSDSRTRESLERITGMIELRPRHRTITPDPWIWKEAGILSGIISRLQGYGKDGRLRILNDALLFASARKFGCAVLTRNIVDFDFLQQLEASGKILFYR
jgi:predicted nucleic acid-binding protein